MTTLTEYNGFIIQVDAEGQKFRGSITKHGETLFIIGTGIARRFYTVPYDTEDAAMAAAKSLVSTVKS